MTLTRLHVAIFVAIAAIVWAAVLWCQGVPLTREHLAPFGTVVGVLVVLGIVFEKRLWKQPWLHGWLVKRPSLQGTWRVELQSDWIDPDTGQGIPVILCFMGVVQTLSTLQMHLMTPESESWFVAEQVRPSPSNQGYQVLAVYTNKPDIHLRGNRSDTHLGALILETHGPESRPDSLTGEYWTERKTKGTLRLAERSATVVTSYTQGQDLFDQPTS